MEGGREGGREGEGEKTYLLVLLGRPGPMVTFSVFPDDLRIGISPWPW